MVFAEFSVILGMETLQFLRGVPPERSLSLREWYTNGMVGGCVVDGTRNTRYLIDLEENYIITLETNLVPWELQEQHTSTLTNK